MIIHPLNLGLVTAFVEREAANCKTLTDAQLDNWVAKTVANFRSLKPEVRTTEVVISNKRRTRSLILLTRPPVQRQPSLAWSTYRHTVFIAPFPNIGSTWTILYEGTLGGQPT